MCALYGVFLQSPVFPFYIKFLAPLICSETSKTRESSNRPILESEVAPASAPLPSGVHFFLTASRDSTVCKQSHCRTSFTCNTSSRKVIYFTLQCPRLKDGNAAVHSVLYPSIVQITMCFLVTILITPHHRCAI